MAMKIYELSANGSSWLLRDKLVPRIRTGMSLDSGATYLGQNDGNLRHYRLATTVDKNDHLHILAEVKDEWHKDKWRMMYYEFNPTTSNAQTYNTAYTAANGGSEGQLRNLWILPVEEPADHVYHPSITVDEGENAGTPKIHAFWYQMRPISLRGVRIHGARRQRVYHGQPVLNLHGIAECAKSSTACGTSRSDQRHGVLRQHHASMQPSERRSKGGQ